MATILDEAGRDIPVCVRVWIASAGPCFPTTQCGLKYGMPTSFAGLVVGGFNTILMDVYRRRACLTNGRLSGFPSTDRPSGTSFPPLPVRCTAVCSLAAGLAP